MDVAAWLFFVIAVVCSAAGIATAMAFKQRGFLVFFSGLLVVTLAAFMIYGK